MNLTCSPCDRPMTLIYQAKDARGVDTFTFHCEGCSGRVGVQNAKAKPPRPKPLPVPFVRVR
jgi:hypothetical protein